MCQYDNEPDFETVWSSIFDLKKPGGLLGQRAIPEKEICNRCAVKQFAVKILKAVFSGYS